MTSFWPVYISREQWQNIFEKFISKEEKKKPKAKLLLIYLSLGMVSTSRSVDNYVRQNQSDGALPQISGIKIFWFE